MYLVRCSNLKCKKVNIKNKLFFWNNHVSLCNTKQMIQETELKKWNALLTFLNCCLCKLKFSYFEIFQGFKSNFNIRNWFVDDLEPTFWNTSLISNYQKFWLTYKQIMHAQDNIHTNIYLFFSLAKMSKYEIVQ
jgi:hypothetical protein